MSPAQMEMPGMPGTGAGLEQRLVELETRWRSRSRRWPS